jgi:hypothetical protein
VGRPEKAVRPDTGAGGVTDAADAAAYAAVTAAVDPDLRRRAGELLAERLEMKTMGRGRELKQLKHSDHFRPVAEFQQALREAAAAQGLGRREKTRENPVVRVTRGSGAGARSWLVTLESRTCYPVVSSCGDAPKEGRSWTAVDVAEVAPASA